MKRVKRKEGKKEGATECAADGVDCKTGSDTHAVCTAWVLDKVGKKTFATVHVLGERE